MNGRCSNFHDGLLPAAIEGYRALVASRGKSDLHRLVLEDDAAHIDTNADMFPHVTPLMPRAHAAFDELVSWVEKTPAAAA